MSVLLARVPFEENIKVSWIPQAGGSAVHFRCRIDGTEDVDHQPIAKMHVNRERRTIFTSSNLPFKARDEIAFSATHKLRISSVDGISDNQNIFSESLPAWQARKLKKIELG